MEAAKSYVEGSGVEENILSADKSNNFPSKLRKITVTPLTPIYIHI
jgi:hypothetical protein